MMTSARLSIDWITTVVVQGSVDAFLRERVARACADLQMHAVRKDDAFFSFDPSIEVVAQDDVLSVGLKARAADTLVVIGPVDSERCFLLREPSENASHIIDTYGIASSSFARHHASIADVVRLHIAEYLHDAPRALSVSHRQAYESLAPLLAFGWVASLSNDDRAALLDELALEGMGRVVVPYLAGGGRVLFIDPRDESIVYSRSGYEGLATTLQDDSPGLAGVRSIPRDERTRLFFDEANEVEILSGRPSLVVAQSEYAATAAPSCAPRAPGLSAC